MATLDNDDAVAGDSPESTMFKMNQNYMVLIWYLIIVIILIYLFVFSQ